MSIDYLKAFLAKKNIYFEEIIAKPNETRWKWLIRFKNIEVYLLKSCRFFVLEKTDEGYMKNFQLNIHSKFELIKYLEEIL